MKGRIPWLTGHADLEGTPEEFAALALALSQGGAPVAQATAVEAARTARTPAQAAPPAAAPARAHAEPHTAVRAAAHPESDATPPGTRVVAALAGPATAALEARVDEDDGKVPQPAVIRDLLTGRADFEHSIRDVFEHFRAGPISPTNPDGTLSALHQRWMENINKARALIIQEKKGFFKTEWRGSEKVYVFWYAPFQEFGATLSR